MIPAEIAVIALLIFMAYQSIFGWIKDRAQQKEIDEIKKALVILDTDTDDIDKRLEKVEQRKP